MAQIWKRKKPFSIFEKIRFFVSPKILWKEIHFRVIVMVFWRKKIGEKQLTRQSILFRLDDIQIIRDPYYHFSDPLRIFDIIKSNLCATTTLGTPKSGCCRQVVVIRRWLLAQVSNNYLFLLIVWGILFDVESSSHVLISNNAFNRRLVQWIAN